MRSRRFWIVSLVALLVVGGLTAWWWQAPRLVRIALLPFTNVNERVMTGFKQALAEYGWVEGSSVEFRAAPMDGAVDKLETHLAQLLAWKPHLVLAMSTPPSQVAYRATKGSGTPVVFAPVTDPLAAGIVTSLAHPGQQATGIRLLPSNGLRLDALLRLAPRARVVYVPHTPHDRSSQSTLEQIKPAAQALGVRLLLQPVDSLEDIARAARSIPVEAQAIFLPQDSRIEAHIDLFVQSAQARRLPLSAPSLLQVEQGALMTYGFDHRAIGRQAARLAAEILQGRPAGDLPVETADNNLYINLRSARAIGLEIDDGLLREAKALIR